MSLIYFLASTPGRVLRAVVGILLILVGWFLLWYYGGMLLALLGVLLLLTAVNDVCLLAAVYSQPINGAYLRAEAEDEHHTLRHSH
jgi:hypothetical protein